MSTTYLAKLKPPSRSITSPAKGFYHIKNIRYEVLLVDWTSDEFRVFDYCHDCYATIVLVALSCLECQ